MNEFNPSFLTSAELKHIINDPKHIGVDGIDYSASMDNIITEYRERVDYQAKDQTTKHLKKKRVNKKVRKGSKKHTELVDKMAYARSKRTKKSKSDKKKAVSLTIHPIHLKTLEDVGEGTYSKGLEKIVQWYIDTLDNILK